MTALSLVALAGCTGTAPTPSPSSSTDFAGSVDIGGGRMLYLECAGEGSPTIILEAGFRDDGSGFSVAQPIPPSTGPSIYPALAEQARTCWYSRPGTTGDQPDGSSAIIDGSTPVDQPRTASAWADDLAALVDAAGIETPFVLVGHSVAGLLIKYYAQNHPDEVAGLVFLDPTSEYFRDAFGAHWEPFVQAITTAPPDLAGDPRLENFDIDQLMDDVLTSPPLRPDLPMAVLSADVEAQIPPELGFTSADLRTWVLASHERLAAETTAPHTIVTGSDHYVFVSAPDVVVDSTMMVVRRALAQ